MTRLAQWFPLLRTASDSRSLSLVNGALVVLAVATSTSVAVVLGITVERIASGADPRRTIVALAVVVLCARLSRLLLEVSTSINGVLAARRQELRTLRLVLSQMDHEALSSPATQDTLHQFRGREYGGALVRMYPSAATAVVVSRLEGLTCIAIAFSIVWFAPLLLAPALVTLRWWIKNETLQMSQPAAAAAGEQRRAAYLRQLAVDSPSAAEIRLYGRHEFIRRAFDARLESAAQLLSLARRARRLPTLVTAVVLTLAFSIVGATGIRFALRGEISLGQLIILIQVLPGALEAAFAGDAEIIAERGAAIIEDFVELSDSTAHDTANSPTTITPQERNRGKIEVHALTVGYEDRAVLANTELVIPLGTSVALVGANGAGKSTLVKALVGLLRPMSGQITVDGKKPDATDRSWTRQLVYVPQQPGRFPGTVRDVVTMFDECVDDEAVWKALETAGLEPSIRNLPRELDTFVGTGFEDATDFSSGQWQLLALAQAFYRAAQGAQLLIFDEPTAALSPEREQDMFDLLLRTTAEQWPDASVLLVSHRLSGARRADVVAVIEDGRIVERGSHDELLGATGSYSRMFRKQAASFHGELL